MDESLDPPSTTPKPPPTVPLLPGGILRPAALLWLWVLPIGVMLLLNLQGYWLVSGNMDDTQRGKALVLGLAGAVNLLAGIAFYLFNRRVATREMSPLFWFGTLALPAVAVQVTYLWMATTLGGRLLPDSVTLWIYPTSRFFFNQYAFAMVPLFLGILRLAGGRAPRDTGPAIAVNLGYAIGAPVLFYLITLGVSSLGAWRSFLSVFVASAVVVLGLLMFVGIVRALLVALRGTARWGAIGERIAIVLCALVLPVGGMLLNRSIPFPVDFQTWEVYALVGVNTAILLLASWRHERWPRVSFGLLCATFPFSLYFFVVFLPFTPLSIVAVIAMGAGFLVLTPTFLFTLHLHLLQKARSAAVVDSRPRGLIVIGLAGSLLLPGFFVARGFADRAALHAALDYVYAPALTDTESTYPGSRANLRRALSSHRHYKNGIYYPLLSDFYTWLVFDNLVLPDDKLAHLEQTFFGTVGSATNPNRLGVSHSIFGGNSVRDRARMPRANPPPRTVAVTKLEVRAHDPIAQSTVVTFVLTLENTGDSVRAGAEYLAKLPLPPGVFVNGFRLHVNGDPVPGRIFEKKTALWVYTMIRDTERRDPGVLVYNRPDELELRVFPVVPDAPTTVEIDFLLPQTWVGENVAALTNDPALELARLGKTLAPHVVHGERGTYLAGGLDTADLPLVEREATIYVIVDRSIENGFSGDLTQMLEKVQKKFPESSVTSIFLANYNVRDLSASRPETLPPIRLNEPELRRILPLAGGLNLDLALATVIRAHKVLYLDASVLANKPAPRANAVLISKEARSRTLEVPVAEAWMDLVPGLEIHEFGADGHFVTHRRSTAKTTPFFRLGSSVRPLMSGYPLRFVPSTEDATLEYWSPSFAAWLPVPDVTAADAASPWSGAAGLQMHNQDYARSPGNAGVTLRTLVQSSRESGVLLPVTSYIVVENEAQWRMLEKSEAQKLGQNAALEFLETPAPPALLVALGFALWLGIRHVRRRAGRVALNGRPSFAER